MIERAASVDAPGLRRSDIVDASARGIASHVAGLIRTGEMTPGHRLPPIRQLAQRLNVSPATVSAAWRLLKRRGLIAGRGKSGIRVIGQGEAFAPAAAAPAIAGLQTGNLRAVFPDPAFLPDLFGALHAVRRLEQLEEYYHEPALPALADAVRQVHPDTGQRLIAASGSSDALWSVLQAISVPRDRVLVETPTSPQYLEIFAELGLEVIPIPYRHGGPDVQAVDEALRLRPVALFFQTRSQIPTGWSLGEENADALALALAAHPECTVIECDEVNDLSPAPLHTLATRLPQQTVHIGSYEKAWGPDLRLAMIGTGDAHADQIEPVVRSTRQWTSRILQQTLAELMTTASGRGVVDGARDIYRERHEALVQALAERGVLAAGGTGLCVWLRVVDEDAALRRLAAAGIAALGGHGSVVGETDSAHIRVASLRVPVDAAPALADVLAEATRADPHGVRRQRPG